MFAQEVAVLFNFCSLGNIFSPTFVVKLKSVYPANFKNANLFLVSFYFMPHYSIYKRLKHLFFKNSIHNANRESAEHRLKYDKMNKH